MGKIQKCGNQWRAILESGKMFTYSINKYGKYAKPLAEQSLQEERKLHNYIEIINEKESIIYFYYKKEDRYIECLIDTEDIDIIREYYWGVDLSEKHPTIRNANNGIYLHRYVMQAGKCDKEQSNVIDHIDRNTFNNRKSNLRIVNNSLNQKNKSIQKNNTSGIPGVRYDKGIDSWVATWHTDKKVRKTKTFSVNKYGYEKAKELAIAQRKKGMSENGYIE